VPRAIWKGAISFGLVHVPVGLFPAAQESGIDFDWLDRRSMDPVGYRRINKRTGKEIAAEDVVRGVKQEEGDYVVLTDDEIKAAYPKATQTIEIETFVEAREIPFFYLERPYLLAPIGKGDKVYALLREAMSELGVIGIARVVMHSKERLAALVPNGRALVLNTIRWSTDLRSTDGIKVPPAGKSAAGIKDGELKMARQLISEMTKPWKPEDYADQFTAAIHALAAKRVKAGRTSQVTAIDPDQPTPSRSNVIDLTELLKRSLRGRQSPPDRIPTRAATANGNGARSRVAKRSTSGAGHGRIKSTQAKPRTVKRAA
jgi:DNA end-binding protein Ku